MDDFSIDSVLKVAIIFFPFVTEENFVHLFKFTALQVANHLKTAHFKTIRNFLILLHWCRHYVTIAALGVLFNLSHQQISKIPMKQKNLLLSFEIT